MKKSLVLIVISIAISARSQTTIRLCDTCPDPPAIDLRHTGEAFNQQFYRAFNDQSWLSSQEALEANRQRPLHFDTVLVSINVPILQRFEFMAKIYQYVIADYRAELAKAELDGRNADNNDDPTGFTRQTASKLKGRKPDFKVLIAEKKRNLERVIESRNKEMGELAEQVK